MIPYRILRRALIPPVRLLWRLDVAGVDRLPPGPCVLAPNHDSLSDPFFVAVAVPRPVRFFGKAELFRFPLGPLLHALGGIPVRRGAGDEGAIRVAVAAVRAGGTVVIHPQGTVLGAADRPWRRGAARVAIEAGVPLVPVALVDTERVLRPGRVRIGFPRVRVLVGEPVDPGPPREPTESEATELTARVRAEVERMREPSAPH